MNPGRIEGYAPIQQYAAIGDGRTLALVAADGAVDWWPVSRLDATPSFAALLDNDHGGSISIAPVEDFSVTRRYAEDTNILETTFATVSGSLRLTDWIPLGQGGQLSWSQLVRRVDGLDGEVRLRWSVAPGNRFNSTQPWVHTDDGALLIANGAEQLAIQSWDLGEPAVSDRSVGCELTISAGQCGVLSITGGEDSPVVIPTRARCVESADLTAGRWRDWAGSIRYDGPWETEVRRSALALKLLTYAPTGAIIAAPTTSLPERVGGEKNWDYRYMWVRDAAFTVDAFLSLELQDEAHAAVKWMLGALRRTSPELRVFYGLDANEPEGQHVIDVAGYRHSRPVRSGNRAARQTQLGTFGDLFEMISLYVRDGHRLDPPSARLLTDLADRCCDVWLTEDAGIWELTDSHHYTVSKIGCWTALDRAVRLADTERLQTPHAARWAAERDRIAAWVNEYCWSQSKRSYTAYAGTDDLDAATLLAARTGFEQGQRLTTTIAAIRSELQHGPSVYRYTGADGEEGAFIACTFWLVNALALNDQVDAARKLMDQAVDMANDVGLFAEQIDPTSGDALGNFPQGLSHLALINAACAFPPSR